MTEQWNGIVTRATLNERGIVPRFASATSPDIVLAGASPFPDPGFLTDPGNYGTVYDNGLYIGRPNYFYVRGKNGTPDALSGRWSLFWATPNILLYPYLWENNGLATSEGNQFPGFEIGPGAIGAMSDPFSWVPRDYANHYCLIAIAETPGHGNPLRGIRDIERLAEAQSLNANIAQRNVHPIRGKMPQVVFQSDYDQGDAAALVDLSVKFENIPKGSSYTISSARPLNGQVLSHRDANTINNNFTYAWADLEIPARWDTALTCAITFGSNWSGIPEGQKPKVTIRADLILGSRDRLYDLAYELAWDAREAPSRAGDRVGLTAGSFGIICPDMGP